MTGARQPLENLTALDRRACHAMVERRRRARIQEKFDQLCLLVPGLAAERHFLSKRLVVQRFGDGLQLILNEIEQLRQELDD